jgi:ribonuclease E
VEMTRKRIGEGLLTSFTSTCPTCEGRGMIVDHDLI